MKDRRTLLAFSFALVLFITGRAMGQDKPAENSSQPQPVVKTGKEYLGPTADSIRPYRPSYRDPFKKAVKPKPGKGGRGSARMIGFPGLEMRRAEFKQKVDQARVRSLSEPDPVTQYLVSELEVTGVFRDDRGFGAFVRAQPTGSMFFIRNGTRCYNGEVLRIEGDSAETGGARISFKEVSYFEQNGKQSLQDRVVVKVPGARN